MAIKKNMIRRQITLTKDQNKWLDEFCLKHNITASKYISYCLVKKAEELAIYLGLEKEDQRTQEEFDKIIKFKWIDD